MLTHLNPVNIYFVFLSSVCVCVCVPVCAVIRTAAFLADDYRLEQLYLHAVRALKCFVHVTEMKAAAHPLSLDGSVAATEPAGDSSCDKLYFTVRHDTTRHTSVIVALRQWDSCGRADSHTM